MVSSFNQTNTVQAAPIVLASSSFDAGSLKVQMLGTIVGAALYGGTVMLYVDCFSLLLRQHRNNLSDRIRNPSKNMRHFLFFFISLLLLLATLAEIQAIMVTTVSIFGGPSKVPALAEGAPVVLPFSVWSSDAFMVSELSLQEHCLSLIQDQLWRCTILYQGIPRSLRLTLLAFISLVFLASLGTITSLVIEGTTNHTDLLLIFIGSGITIFMNSITQRLPILLMVSFSTFLNIVVCLLIVLRLTFHQKYLQMVLGPGHGSAYTRVKAMSVESASLLIALGIPFVILVAANSHNGSMFVLLLYPQVCVSSLFV